MFYIEMDGYKHEYEQPVKLLDIAKKMKKDCMAAKVNGRVRELDFYVYSDSFVEFIGPKNPEVSRMYESTLRYIILKALNELFPGKKVIVSNFISRTVKFHLRHYKVTEEDAERLIEKVKEIIDADLPIQKKRLSLEELVEHYRDQQYFEKIKLLNNSGLETVKAYECDGYYNYMFSMMLPSTGYIKNFEIKTYDPGFIVQYPRSEMNGAIPEFEESTTFKTTIENQSKWLKQLNIHNILDLNEVTNAKDKMVNFVNMCETKQNDALAELGGIIKGNIENIRLIAIAGPSSSGKTTFCNRLRIELLTKGIKPLMISIDDYYNNRELYPLDEYGKPDYEHIDSLNVELFNKHLKALIEGEEIELPTFDFDAGISKPSGRMVKLECGQVILIEGIHALNEKLTNAIPRENKFKIFISPHSMFNIDDHTPITASDLRLLRRIVRDKLFRGASVEHTLNLWDNVRKGEFKWIYPFHTEADYTFNTELTYEVMVMKKYALPSLLSVKKTSPYYMIIKRLGTFLSVIKDIEDKYVPVNSILREFVGGSCFYEK